MTHFEELNKINVNDRVEKKNGLTYLSWAFAWAEVKKVYPDAKYNIKKFDGGLPYVFDPKTGYMVFTDVTIDSLTHEMWLPVMDGANAAMKDVPYQYQVSQWQNGKKVIVTKDCAAADMFDINKTIMRCLVKNLAMFGMGLYIYAGEDLPEGEEPVKVSPVKPEPVKVNMTVTNEVLAARKVDLADISARYEIAPEALKAVTQGWGSKKLNEMTDQEYMDFTTKLKARFS